MPNLWHWVFLIDYYNLLNVVSSFFYVLYKNNYIETNYHALCRYFAWQAKIVCVWVGAVYYCVCYCVLLWLCDCALLCVIVFAVCDCVLLCKIVYCCVRLCIAVCDCVLLCKIVYFCVRLCITVCDCVCMHVSVSMLYTQLMRPCIDRNILHSGWLCATFRAPWGCGSLIVHVYMFVFVASEHHELWQAMSCTIVCFKTHYHVLHHNEIHTI